MRRDIRAIGLYHGFTGGPRMSDETEERLAELIRSGDDEAVSAWVEKHPDVLKRPYRGTVPWLVLAAGVPRGPDEPDPSGAVVRFLLECGLDPNQPEMRDGHPPIWPIETALEQGNYESCSFLMNHGAVENGWVRLENEFTELVRAGDVAGARVYLEKHPEVRRQRGRDPKPWLVLAAQGPSVEMVRFLLDQGFDVNEPELFRGKPDRWPLCSASTFENFDMFRLLLERGADPNVGRVLIGAIAGGNPRSLEMVKLLHQHGADLHKVWMNEQIGVPMNALETAEGWGKDDVVAYLRAQGCQPLPPAPPRPVSARRGRSLTRQVVAYFEREFGPVRPQSIVEIVPTEPRIAVHVIPPPKPGDPLTLFTTGMAHHRMARVTDEGDFRYGEVFVQLPGDWNWADLQNPAWGWPVLGLRWLAQYPYLHDTGIGGTVVASNGGGNDAEPVGPGLPFTAWLLLAEKQMTTKGKRLIHFYRALPLYPEEGALFWKKGPAALMRAFDRAGTPFVVDLSRPNSARKRWWFW